MRLNDGLAEWSNELKNIYVTREVRGLEWLFDLTIWALQIATLSQIVQICVWGRRYQVPTWFTEAYVCAVTIILCFLWWSDDVTRVSAVVVGYLLGTTIIVLFNVVFLSKLSFIGPVASHERTLLLFMLNIAQVVLAFAIFYRLQLPDLPAGNALFEALLVFGTISHPKGADAIAGLQIVIDFVLLAVFLAFFVGKLGTRDYPSCQ